MFRLWIISSSSLDLRFLLEGIYVLETFLDNSSTFLNLGFWEILKERPYEIIKSAKVIVRWVSLEVSNFWELPSIPKRSEAFEKLLELLLVVIFDTEVKPETVDELWMVDFMAAYDLFYKLAMDAFIFSKWSRRTSLWVYLKCWRSWYLVIWALSIGTYQILIFIPFILST